MQVKLRISRFISKYRMGVNVWQIGEVVILELTGGSARRLKNKATGFEFLEC